MTLIGVLGAWTKTLPEGCPQESMRRGDCLLLKVLRYGGSDWLSDLPKVTQQFLKQNLRPLLSCSGQRKMKLQSTMLQLSALSHSPASSLTIPCSL